MVRGRHTKGSSEQITIEYQPINSLRPHPSNARTHSNHQIRQIAKSIREFGFTNPVLLDKDGSIVAGHGRVAAAKLLGIRQVPTIRLESLSPDQIRAYVLADNRLAEKAGWDKSILAIELQHLLTIDDFDITITGFEVPEIDLLLCGPEPCSSVRHTIRVGWHYHKECGVYLKSRDRRAGSLSRQRQVDREPHRPLFLRSPPDCTCPDYKTRGCKCKHIFAATFVLRREQNADGTVTITKAVQMSAVTQTTYTQEWAAYNEAQYERERQVSLPPFRFV